MSVTIKQYITPFNRERILYALTTLFMITLYVPHIEAINSISIGLLFAFSLLFNPFSEKWKLLKERKAVQLMLAFFALHIISALFSADKKEALHVLVLRLPLLIFPAAFGLITIQQKLKLRLLLTYAIITTIAALTCMLLSAIQYLGTHEAYFLYSNDLSKWVDRQSTYMASMVNIAIFCYIYLLHVQKQETRHRVLIYTAITVLTVIMFLLASRMAMVAFGTCALLYAGYLIIKNRSLALGLGVSGTLIAAFFVLSSFFPKTISRFAELKHTNYEFSRIAPESNYNYAFDANQWNGANIRMAIWNCGWQLAGKNPVLGSGIGDKTNAVMDTYKQNNFIFGYTTHRNLHSTYLDVLVTFGITGLTLLLLGYIILPLWSSIKNKDLLTFFILIEVMWQLFPESYLDRSIGCIELAFFISLTESWRKRKSRLAAVIIPFSLFTERGEQHISWKL